MTSATVTLLQASETATLSKVNGRAGGHAFGSGTLKWPTGITLIGAWTDQVIRHGLIEFPEGPSYAGKIFGEPNRAYEADFVAWLESTAHAGSPSVQYLLAKVHLENKLENVNLQTGLSWLERSAEQALAVSHYQFAVALNSLSAVNNYA